MKNIVKKVDQKKGLTVYKVTGKVTANELIDTIVSFYREATPNVLWDLINSDVSDIKENDIKHIAQTSINSATNRPSGKTALVSLTDLTFGLSKMYEAYKKNRPLPFETKVFRDIEKAYKWIQS